jgi:hypothetical protein
MECFDPRTNVNYPDHEEWVTETRDCLGICTRCGEICDLAACRVMARRGNVMCQRAMREAGYEWAAPKTAAP